MIIIKSIINFYSLLNCRYYCLFITILFVSVINAQIPTIEWQKCYGGTYREALDGNAGVIEKTINGGYIVATTTNSINGDVIGNHGGLDAWVIKLDVSGNVQWQKCFGGSGDEGIYSIQQTNDGGYIMTGFAGSNDGDLTGVGYHKPLSGAYSDIWVVKLSSVGTIQWQKCYGGWKNDRAYCIQICSDGGYIIAGSTNSTDGDVPGIHGVFNDAWIIKLSSSGSIQWQKCLGGTNQDLAFDIQNTNDGGYILVGRTESKDGDVSGWHTAGNQGYERSDAWIVKLSPTGIIQWQKCLGGTGYDYAYSIFNTDDGGYILSGYTDSNDGDVNGNKGKLDLWIVKISNIGILQWQKCIGGSEIEGDYNFSKSTKIQQTNDGEYIVISHTGSNNGDVTGWHEAYYNNNPLYNPLPDIWVVKLTTDGLIKWQRCLGGRGYDYACNFQQSNDGGIILLGSSTSNDGDVSGNHGSYDALIIKLSPEIITNINDKVNNHYISLFPNPTQTQLQLSEKFKIIEVYNTNGKLMQIENNTDNLQVKNLNKGVYILKGITIQGNSVETKFIKE